MAVEITVILDGAAGGMARVITALKRSGLSFSGHHIEKIDDSRSRLTVNAEGSAAAGELREILADIKGVAEVVGIGTDGGAAREREPAPVVATDAAGLESFADRLVNEYPRILRHIDAFEQALPGDQDLGRQLRHLGSLVGSGLGARDSALQEAGTLQEALEGSVVPILDSIAEPEVVGDGDIRVRLSIFTRRQVNTMDLVFGGEASRCDFLSGMIEGMVAKAPAVADVNVEETSCRTNGDEYCLFQVRS